MFLYRNQGGVIDQFALTKIYYHTETLPMIQKGLLSNFMQDVLIQLVHDDVRHVKLES